MLVIVSTSCAITYARAMIFEVRDFFTDLGLLACADDLRPEEPGRFDVESN